MEKDEKLTREEMNRNTRREGEGQNPRREEARKTRQTRQAKNEETPTREEKTAVEGEKVREEKPSDEEEAGLRARLEKAEKEIKEGKDSHLRLLAEYDNFRKRSAKEKAESFSSGMIKAVSDLLPVIDSLEMALAAPCSDENFKKGIEMTLNRAKAALKNLGVEEIEALGKPFDPALHSAVMQEQAEGVEPGIVTRQLQKGYKTADKVIRHSTVAVSR